MPAGSLSGSSVSCRELDLRTAAGPESIWTLNSLYEKDPETLSFGLQMFLPSQHEACGMWPTGRPFSLSKVPARKV